MALQTADSKDDQLYDSIDLVDGKDADDVKGSKKQ